MAIGWTITARNLISVVPCLTFALWALVAFSGFGTWLETTLLGHMLVEIPLLVLTGVALGNHYRALIAPWWQPWNSGGIAGVLLASFTLAFWMIPRWLDASLTDPGVATAKYLSLPILVGLPLAMSWLQLHPIARGLVKIEFLTMLVRLGWLYLISPNRLCNNYLLEEQVWLGQGFIIIAIALSITWLIPVFFGTHSEKTLRNNSIQKGI